MDDVQEGLKEMEKGKTIMFTDNDLLKEYFNQNSKYSPQRIRSFRTFGAQEHHLGWIFTENSPLVPLFKQTTIKMFESGEFRRAQLKWHGPDIVREEGTDEIEILSIGQLVLPFMIFGLFLIVSIIPLMIECCYKKITSFARISKGSSLAQLQGLMKNAS